jgi:hypothetical protein
MSKMAQKSSLKLVFVTSCNAISVKQFFFFPFFCNHTPLGLGQPLLGIRLAESEEVTQTAYMIKRGEDQRPSHSGS